ncbi:Uncharacterised protein [Mycobacteroides abscessus subsp. abscessus]|nr:Uncharacterised protein [Mycobacteroides abscessus subsp. abscessus]
MVPARTPSSRYCSASSIERRRKARPGSPPDCTLCSRYLTIGANVSISSMASSQTWGSFDVMVRDFSERMYASR